MNAPLPFTDDELARRRAAGRKLAWALGTLVLALYILGFFIQR